MKVSELINKLKELPSDLDVMVFDYRKNLHDDVGEGSSEGIHHFVVDICDISEKEKKEFEKCHGFNFKPFVQLTFDNDDYPK